MHSKRKLLLLLLASLVSWLWLVSRYFRNHDAPELRLSDWFDPRKRPDVVTSTGWLAPVIWEGTFSRRALRDHYGRRNLTVGLAVFAAGRAADRHLEPFLRSAKKHFMAGYRAVFYIMVDDPHRLQDLEPGPRQTFKVLTVAEDRRWRDLDLVRLRQLRELITQHVWGEVDFLFSAAADRVFQGHFGVETLGSSVAQLHAWWYFRAARDFPYERRPRSAAYIPPGHGDFFYDGALVGGTPLRVLHLVEECLQGALHDVTHGLNSTYESHLNKYFFLHKPATLLSPEYGWDSVLLQPAQVRYVKVLRCSKGTL